MNQRRRTRVLARKLTTLVWPDGECRGEIENLSLKGCLIGPPQGDVAAPGRDVSVVIHLEPDAPELDVRVRGRIVRVDPQGVAVDFTEIELESFRHLFRLVQYNAPDPDGIEDELGTSAFPPAPDDSA
jgi:hypothetical protein